MVGKRINQTFAASTAPAVYDKNGGINMAATVELEFFNDEGGSYLQQEVDGRLMVC